MKKFVIFILLLVLLAFLLYWFVFRGKGGTANLSEEDRLALVEDSAAGNNVQPHDSIVFPNTVLGKQLQNHMMILALPAETLEEADARYDSSLAELKKNAVEAVTLLTEAYKKTEARHYYNRWGLVKTLGDIGNNTAAPPLQAIVLAKLPAETSQDLHHFSTQEEEIIIKIRAIEGLGMLAKNGDQVSDRVLLQLALDSTQTNSALQLRAIKAYLRAGKDTGEREKLLKSRLDKKLHDIITTAVTRQEEFMSKMEDIKKLSTQTTNKEKTERPSTKTEAPRMKAN
jgi:hypothetical protein